MYADIKLRSTFAALFLVITGFFIVHYELQASYSTSATYSGEKIFLLEDLNFDCSVDTVIGTVSDCGQARLKHILWAPSSTSASCTSSIPAHLKVSKTSFSYPTWNSLRVMSMICRINDDSLSDFGFFIEGRAILGQNTVDTAKVSIVFGQKGLDTLSTIYVAEVDSFQTAPYVGLDLTMGVELVEADIRDLGGRESYVMENIVLDVETISGSSVYAPPDPGTPWEVLLYPNPAFTVTNLEGRKLPEGAYSVDLITLQGKLVLQRKINVGKSGEFYRQLQLQELATGYYVVRIYDEGKVIGNYAVVIGR